MATNRVQPGEVMPYTPTSAVASGQPIIIGARVGVAQTDVAANEPAEFAVSDVYSLPKASVAISAGVDVYLTSSGQITTTATGNTKAGFAFRAAASGDATVDVKLNR